MNAQRDTEGVLLGCFVERAGKFELGVRMRRMPAGFGAPGQIRTADLLVRSQTLYPTELRAQQNTV